MQNSKNFRYLAEISDKLGNGSYFELEILREGNWTYQGEPLDIPKSLLAELKNNFDSKLYYPVPVDGPVRGGSAHSTSDAHDCGFVEGLDIRLGEDKLDHLWAIVRLTNKDASEMVDEGSLCTCSSEFMSGWIEPASNSPINVLSGLGLTNRPFIKNMAPARKVQTVNLSEYENSGFHMNEQEIAALRAQVATLAESSKANAVMLSEMEAIKKEREVLLNEKKVLEFSLKAQEQAHALTGFYEMLKGVAEKNASLSPDFANKAMKLAEVIIKSGVRKVQLMDGDGSQAAANGSIFHNDGQEIRKCDLIELLTETINALPGNTIYVKPTGRSGGDAIGEDFDVEENDSGKQSGEFKFSDRFTQVTPKSHGITSDAIMKKTIELMEKNPKLDAVEATKMACEAHGIKNLSEVK